MSKISKGRIKYKCGIGSFLRYVIRDNDNNNSNNINNSDDNNPFKVVFSKNLVHSKRTLAIFKHKHSEHALARRPKQQVMLMQSNMKHSARDGKKHARRDLHY